MVWTALWAVLLAVSVNCYPKNEWDVNKHVKNELKTLNGDWGIVKELPLPSTPDIPLVACGGKADKEHGVLRGKVLCARTGKPLPRARISYSHSRGRCETSTDRYGEYSITVEVWESTGGSGERKITYSKNGYQTALAFYKVVLGKSKWVPAVALPHRYFRGSARGEVKGVVRSSSTGHRIIKSCPCNVCVKPVVKVRQGANAKSTRILGEAKVIRGKFRIWRLIPGVYTLELQVQCFIPRLTTVVVESGKTTHLSKRVFLVPEFVMTDEPRLRFLLTWGARPANLDLHLVGILLRPNSLSNHAGLDSWCHRVLNKRRQGFGLKWQQPKVSTTKVIMHGGYIIQST